LPCEQRGVLGLERFVRTKRPVDFWRERERGACKGLMVAVFGTRESYEGEKFSGDVAVKGFHNEYGGRMNIGNSGFNLLTQLTEIITSLFIFDKQWHTCL